MSLLALTSRWITNHGAHLWPTVATLGLASVATPILNFVLPTCQATTLLLQDTWAIFIFAHKALVTVTSWWVTNHGAHYEFWVTTLPLTSGAAIVDMFIQSTIQVTNLLTDTLTIFAHKALITVASRWVTNHGANLRIWVTTLPLTPGATIVDMFVRSTGQRRLKQQATGVLTFVFEFGSATLCCIRFGTRPGPLVT